MGTAPGAGVLRGISEIWSPEERIGDAALVWRDGRIEWLGPETALPDGLGREQDGYRQLDAGGRLVVPGLIDCHTHLAFGGWREDEFVQRLEGRSYLEIASAGGGIARTVRQTRAASFGDLVAKAGQDLEAMRRLGVTTVECKSGYGLSYEEELKLLEVYAELARSQPTRIEATLLAAHVVPEERREGREGYVEMIAQRLIPEVARRSLARFCDVFVEDGAFTAGEARTVLRAGQEHGLGAKLHVDQIGAGGGAELAAELGAVSADHLERVSERGIEALAEAGVVAVSLPFASLYLGQPLMPARRLVEAGAELAVATDYNPGSAPSYELPLALWLACVGHRLAPERVLAAATTGAARALALDDGRGRLEPGAPADLAVLDAESLSQWLYWRRSSVAAMTVIGGTVVWRASEQFCRGL